MRLFIAISLPSAMRERLESAYEPLRDGTYPVRWVSVANIHLTLKFLGEVAEERVAAVSSAVDAVVADREAFQLTATTFGAFPSLARPQVIWIGVDPSPELGVLQGRIERTMEELGFPKEKRKFHPHLTLGRARKGTTRSDFRGLGEMMTKLEYQEEFPVLAVDVICSRLTPTGAVYTVLHSAELNP
jgi:2'-5' RNA ligase